MIEEAKQNGGKVHTPNNLPVGSIDRDGNMWEHEHGDHPDYKFPVDAEYCGPEEDAPHFVNGEGKRSTDCEEMNDSLRHETHALIYTDGHIALTLYECTYALWDGAGLIKAGQMWKKGHWKLTAESCQKIGSFKR